MKTIVVKRDKPGTIDYDIGRFKTLVSGGVESFQKAGELICRMLKRDPKCFHKIIERSPWMTYELLNAFVQIGEKKLYPYVMLDQSPGARRISIFPYEEQKKLFTGTIEVVSIRNNVIHASQKRLQELTRKEVEIAFSDSGVRPAAEQRSLLKEEATRTRMVAPRASEGDREDDNISVEGPEDDDVATGPIDIDSLLIRAQLAMLKVRELLGEKNTAVMEKHITNALNAIGGLRFEMKSQAEAPAKNGSSLPKIIPPGGMGMLARGLPSRNRSTTKPE